MENKYRIYGLTMQVCSQKRICINEKIVAESVQNDL